MVEWEGEKERQILLPVITSIITWYMFCSLGGISWHRFSHQPKCCIFNGNIAYIFNRREGLAKIKENPALGSFILSYLVFPFATISSVKSSTATLIRCLLWATALKPDACQVRVFQGSTNSNICLSPQCFQMHAGVKAWNLLLCSAWSFLTLS